MKKICALMLLFVFPVALIAQSGFTISGILKNMEGKSPKVYISYESKGERVNDSCKAINGKYHFKGTIDQPGLAQLNIYFDNKKVGMGSMLGMGSMNDLFVIFLDKGNMVVRSDKTFRNFSVSGQGAAAHIAYENVETLLKPCIKMTENIAAAEEQFRKSGKSMDMTEVNKKVQEAWECRVDVYKKYLVKNPSSPIAMYALNNYAGRIFKNVEEAQSLFNSLPAKTRSSPDGKAFAQRLYVETALVIGKPALGFTQADTSGNPVSLSSFKGKYVLVDFWASWCGPCRRENPAVVAAYHKYHDKGFAVLGVSLDKENDKDKWLEAIKKDGLPWTQVSDLQGWNNVVAKQYAIESIPQNFLLDPDGIIIAKNLRGAALDEKLATIFNK